VSVVAVWVVTHCGPVDNFRRFGGTHRLCVQFTLKMDAKRFSETLVTTYKTTRLHNPEDCN
jgi:hypothetical protein